MQSVLDDLISVVEEIVNSNVWFVVFTIMVLMAGFTIGWGLGRLSRR